LLRQVSKSHFLNTMSTYEMETEFSQPQAPLWIPVLGLLSDFLGAA